MPNFVIFGSQTEHATVKAVAGDEVLNLPFVFTVCVEGDVRYPIRETLWISERHMFFSKGER